MNRPPLHFHLGALLALTVGGCASTDGRYPSLAIRDAERAQGTLTPSPPEQPAVVGITDLDGLMAPLVRARKIDAEFAAQKDEVNALILASSGLGPDDDRRARALIGYAELTSLRGQTALALSDLDQLEAAAAIQFKRPKDINDLQASIQRMLAQQDEALDSLSETLAK